MKKHFLLKISLIIMSIVCLLIPLSSCGKKIQQWAEPPAMQIDTTKTYYAVFDTSLGTFKVELWASAAPITVNNFIFLSEQKFYDGTTFHRIRKNFMIQGGNPDPKGTIGNPGYNIPDELPPKGNYDTGILAMAKSYDPNTGSIIPNSGGSQFFICTGANAASLNTDPDYTQFGKVVEGWDVVLEIAAVEVSFYNNEFGTPKNPPVIKHITITES
jgi:peptidylprolyl isomerase/peptidyl-prolyl cis-trans isomerase B (cyclophilin B)